MLQIAGPPQFAGHLGEIGHRSGLIQLAFRLGASAAAGLSDPQLCQAGQSVLRYHPQAAHTAPSHRYPAVLQVRPVRSVRVTMGTLCRVTAPAGQVQVPRARSMTKSSLGKCVRWGRPGTRATSLRPTSAKSWRVPPARRR